MKHYQRILVPVDFTEMGELVTTQAQATANQYQAQLTLLHVVQDIPPSLEAFGESSAMILNAELEDELVKTAHEQMQLLAEKLSLPAEAVLIATGIDTTDTILTVAEQQNTDLIVIGHSGKKGFLGLLGSTATSVVKAAKCDVLVVRR